MRLIAGHPSRPTPSFQDTVSQIILNPSWSVPRTIGVLDLLPSQQEDPTFSPASVSGCSAPGTGKRPAND